MNAQDILILKSGKELRVQIVDDGQEIVSYREYGSQSGPLYSIGKDKIAEIKYSKNHRIEKAQPDNTDKKQDEAASRQSTKVNELTVNKRYIYQGSRKLGSRGVRTIMEDTPEALQLYEAGYKRCNMSNACPVGVLLTSFVSTMIMNKQEDQSDKNRTFAVGMSLNGVFLISGIVLSSTGKKYIRKSVETYNSASAKPETLNLSLGVRNNGLAITLRF
jgi:hypothetical protein